MELLTPQEIQRFRDISIHEMLGMQNNGRRIDGACPFCKKGGRTPCFALYADNSFHCYSCNAHGNNAIDFMKTLTGKKNFTEILSDLLPHV